MNRGEMLSQLQDILRDEFDDDNLIIKEETTAHDVKDWDSLTHLSLINEVERYFGIKFTMGEIQEFKNVGEMMDSIEKHLVK